MMMISVKSTMERMIQALIASYEPLNDSNTFFTAVERMVAGLFASQQIDSNYIVRPSGKNIEIRFSTGGHSSCLTYMLPSSLEWKAEALANNTIRNTGPFTDEDRELARSFNVREASRNSSRRDPITYTIGGGGGGAGGAGGVAISLSGADIKTFVDESISKDVSLSTTVPSDNPTPNRALEAYEKAKKAVEGM